MIKIRNLVLIALLCVCWTNTALAQDLSVILPTLLQRSVTLAGNPNPAPGQISHAGHFEPSASGLELPTQMNAALVTALTTFPIGSSSGGFVFEGDPTVGDFRPASRTYGSSFAERALTAGKGTFSFGMHFQAARFDKFEGETLDDGSIKFYLTHEDVAPNGALNPFFEGDLIQASVFMEVKTDTTAFLLNYGLTDRLDVGAAVPIQHVSLNASVLATVDRAATAAIPGIHRFDGSDPDHNSQSLGNSATGIGDILLRSRYRIWKVEGGGLAAGLDLRLPTGDEENLLGLGTTQAKFSLIGSKESSSGFSPHFNVSYTLSGEGNLPGVTIADEVGYIFGAEVGLGRVTIAGDFIGRTLIDFGRFSNVTQTFPLCGNNACQGPNSSFTRPEFSHQDGSLTQLIGAAGVKVLLASRFLLTGNVLFSINEAGLTDRFVPVVGLDTPSPADRSGLLPSLVAEKKRGRESLLIILRKDSRPLAFHAGLRPLFLTDSVG